MAGRARDEPGACCCAAGGGASDGTDSRDDVKASPGPGPAPGSGLGPSLTATGDTEDTYRPTYLRESCNLEVKGCHGDNVCVQSGPGGGGDGVKNEPWNVSFISKGDNVLVTVFCSVFSLHVERGIISLN